MQSFLQWVTGWAIWAGIILVLGIAAFLAVRHRLQRIGATMRGEEVPPDDEWRGTGPA